MEINPSLVEEIVRRVVAQQAPESAAPSPEEIPVGVSNRHIHLTHEDVETLFGKGYQLTPLKELSQPGQYACKETVTIVGPSMRPIEKVRVLGPERSRTQIEISRTDSYQLKVKPPVRESGKVDGSAPMTVIGPCGVRTVPEGCIIANRHIHMSEADGRRFGIRDGEYVTVDADGARRTRFYDVQVRVNNAFVLEMHLDTDDANAAGLGNGSKVRLVRE